MAIAIVIIHPLLTEKTPIEVSDKPCFNGVINLDDEE